MTGWGAVFEGRPASGEWTEEFLSWHINCLELRAVFLALMYFLPVLGGYHVIVRTDNMAVVSHINRQGGSRSRTLDRLARRLLLWSQDKFLSLRAVHVPGILNLADDFLLRQKLRPVEWTLNRQTVWDLSVVLEGLVTAPFEPLESVSERILTLKVSLLLALTSLKRVGDLQAFSVRETCMDFAPGLVKVTLRPRPGYIPKVLSTSFRSQVVTLHSFHPPPFASSEDERLHMLCPVRALRLYVDRSKGWRKSPQLLVCFGAGRHGLATSKQRISHWVRDAISLAYEARNLPSPLSLRAHSTRGVASSQALFRGVPLEDMSSPHTFVKFYNLDVDTAPGSQILSV